MSLSYSPLCSSDDISDADCGVSRDPDAEETLPRRIRRRAGRSRKAELPPESEIEDESEMSMHSDDIAPNAGSRLTSFLESRRTQERVSHSPASSGDYADRLPEFPSLGSMDFYSPTVIELPSDDDAPDYSTEPRELLRGAPT